MAVYFKYKSAKDYDSIPIIDRFISVANLKLKIFESKCYGRGKDFDLLVTKAQTNDDYVDHDTLIPRNTSVLIRRVPGLPCLPIVITESSKQVLCDQEEVDSVKKESISEKYSQDFDFDDFGDDVYTIPKVVLIQSGNPVQSAPSSSLNDEEDTKVKNLIVSGGKRSPEYNTRSPFVNGFGSGRGGMEWKNPPSGYVCHRCNMPGHFIQHCPTNGDPNYDIKKVKPPSVSVGVLKRNEDAFSKEFEGLSSSYSSSLSSKCLIRDIPSELHCPLCKGLMKDAVIASKCCFSSFCDKCIRDHIISNSACVCGARNILTDALLPNLTLRVTTNRILQSSSSSSSEHGVSVHNTLAKIPFPSESVLSIPPQKEEETCRSLKTVEECPIAVEVKMKKRKKPSDAAAAANMQWGVAQEHVVAESNMLTMNPAAYHPLPEESFRGQYVESRKSGFKRNKHEISIEFPSVITY